MLKPLQLKLISQCISTLLPIFFFFSSTNYNHWGSAHFILYREEVIVQPQLDLPPLDYKELLVHIQTVCFSKCTTFPSSVSTSGLSVHACWTRNLYFWFLLVYFILALRNIRVHTCLKPTPQNSDLLPRSPCGDEHCSIWRWPLFNNFQSPAWDGKRRSG